MERKIGEIFKYDDVFLRVVEHPNQFTFEGTCSEDCYFYDKACSPKCSYRDRNITGQCQYASRSDCKGVYFKRIVK